MPEPSTRGLQPLHRVGAVTAAMITKALCGTGHFCYHARMGESPSLSSRVRISEDALFQELSGETVLLELSRGVYYGLDDVGTRIWQLLGEGRSLAETLAALVAEYDVTAEQGAEDLLALVRELEEHRLIAICS